MLYTLSFQYFDGAEWGNRKYTIIAPSIIRLMREYLRLTEWISLRYSKDSKDEIRKDLWKEVRGDIKKGAVGIIDEGNGDRPSFLDIELLNH